MIVWQVHDHQIRELLALAIFPRLHKTLKLVEEFICAQLVRVFHLKVGYAGSKCAPAVPASWPWSACNGTGQDKDSGRPWIAQSGRQ